MKNFSIQPVTKTNSIKMLNRTFLNLCVVAALTSGLAACSQDTEMTKAQNETAISVENDDAVFETTNAPQTIEEATVLMPQEVDGFTTTQTVENNLKSTEYVMAKNEINSTLLFEFDSSVLSASEKTELLEIADKMIMIEEKGDSNLIWQVVGYSDAVGKALYNERLAFRRATAVADYLISQGVNESLLSVVSLGSSDTKSVNNAEDYLDRRVDVHLYQEEVVTLAKQLQEILDHVISKTTLSAKI